MRNNSLLCLPLSSLLLTIKHEDIGAGPALRTKQSWSYWSSGAPSLLKRSYALHLNVLILLRTVSYCYTKNFKNIGPTTGVLPEVPGEFYILDGLPFLKLHHKGAQCFYSHTSDFR